MNKLTLGKKVVRSKPDQPDRLLRLCSKHEQYTAIAWIKGRIEVNRALQANILAKYELNVSTMPRRYVRKRVAAWSTEGTWILPWNWFGSKNSASRLPQWALQFRKQPSAATAITWQQSSYPYRVVYHKRLFDQAVEKRRGAVFRITP